MLDKKTEETVLKIAYGVREYGGTAYFVGGFVRDRLMGADSTDVDIEVHGIKPKILEKILDSLGNRLEIGKSFGIYSLSGLNIDVAMPRIETLTGIKHRDFKIDVDPFVGTKKAAVRRDFTVNSIMQDIISGEIIDHFGGREDLENKVLRHVNDNSFGEDPLRVLRGAQFAARFDFDIALETAEICRKIDLSNLSPERVFDELKKALLKSEKPSVFFKQLLKMNQLSYWFREIAQLIGIKQHSRHHKEGDVWNHTMMVVDEAAKCRDSAEHPLYFMLSALVHDFGKIVSTKFVNGEYRAYSHETEGTELIEKFLRRITNETALIKYCVNMAKLHMKPNVTVGDNSSVKATNKMFDSSKSPEDLILLALCDGRGKIPASADENTERFLRERLDIYREYMSRPYVNGQDLINAGVMPGKDFSQLLNYAHKLRLAGVSKENALKQVLAFK